MLSRIKKWENAIILINTIEREHLIVQLILIGILTIKVLYHCYSLLFRFNATASAASVPTLKGIESIFVLYLHYEDKKNQVARFYYLLYKLL